MAAQIVDDPHRRAMASSGRCANGIRFHVVEAVRRPARPGRTATPPCSRLAGRWSYCSMNMTDAVKIISCAGLTGRGWSQSICAALRRQRQTAPAGTTAGRWPAIRPVSSVRSGTHRRRWSATPAADWPAGPPRCCIRGWCAPRADQLTAPRRATASTLTRRDQRHALLPIAALPAADLAGALTRNSAAEIERLVRARGCMIAASEDFSQAIDRLRQAIRSRRRRVASSTSAGRCGAGCAAKGGDSSGQ